MEKSWANEHDYILARVEQHAAEGEFTGADADLPTVLRELALTQIANRKTGVAVKLIRAAQLLEGGLGKQH